jgi:hypothetical protein
MADGPIPSVVAMLVCDQIVIEQGTGKKSLIGVFENIFTQGFPSQLSRVAVYVKMVDALGKYNLRLRLVKLKDETPLADITLDADVKDSLVGVEIALNMVNLPIPEPGKYEFQLYANEIYLHRATVNAIQGGPPWQQQQPR